MKYNHEFWVPEFSLRNFCLPFLVSEAAIDIDNHKPNQSQECGSVKYLSQLLNEITQGENPRVKFSNNSVVLGYAISGREKFEEYWKDKSIDEEINLIAKDLRDFKNLSKIRQKELSNFCVRLSRETTYHHSQYYLGDSRLVA